MRRVVILFLATGSLAACGGGGGGEEPKEGGGTRQQGSSGEQVSAEGVAQLSTLVDAVEDACGEGSGGGSTDRLDEAVDAAVLLAEQSSPQAIVELNDADRAPPFERFLQDQADLLEGCGQGEAAEKLRSAQFGVQPAAEGS